MSVDSITEDELQGLRTVTAVVYALQAASFLFGVSFVAGVIVNYVKKPDVEGTWLESHFRWQIRTFWFGLLWFVIAFFVPIIGNLMAIACALWIIYRIVVGWLRLNDGKTMY